MKTSRRSSRSNRVLSHLRIAAAVTLISAAVAMAFIAARPSSAVAQSAPTYNTNTLAGKAASVNAVKDLAIRFSAFIQQEADEPGAPPAPLPAPTPITPTPVLTRP